MTAFIKCSTYKNIQKKFVLLYSLNISDIIFTLVLLKTGFFREFNGFMAQVVNNTSFSLILKIIVVGILILIVLKRMEVATKKQLKISNLIINGILGVYIIINLMHIGYMFLYIII